MASKGQNVWFDLMTTDTDGAKRFYTEVIGWKTQAWEDADPTTPYTLWVASKGPIGGLMTLPEEAKKMGAPPHWLAYTAVDDVAATAKHAEELGGKIYKPPTDIPKVGCFAVLADPQGAVFAVFKAEDDMSAPEDVPGHFSWAELNTTDYDAAWKFYLALFGWEERSKMEMDGGDVYFMFEDPKGKTKGGMCNLAAKMGAPPHWLQYVTVDGMDAALERIKNGGGKILNGPMPIPGDDVIAQCQDPQGAAFAVYSKTK